MNIFEISTSIFLIIINIFVESLITLMCRAVCAAVYSIPLFNFPFSFLSFCDTIYLIFLKKYIRDTIQGNPRQITLYTLISLRDTYPSTKILSDGNTKPLKGALFTRCISLLIYSKSLVGGLIELSQLTMFFFVISTLSKLEYY